MGHTKNASVANAAGNARNGKSKKTLKGDFGELPIDRLSSRTSSCCLIEYFKQFALSGSENYYKAYYTFYCTVAKVTCKSLIYN